MGKRYIELQEENKGLHDELVAVREGLLYKRNVHEKLEKEFVKLQEFANKQLAQNRSLKQAIQQLGEVIAHL